MLLIPTDSPGLARRPFASAAGRDDEDFNEVFFTDVRVPVENLVGPLNEGWRVANGSLGHERNMLWMGYANQLQEMTADFEPAGELERDRYATLVMDHEALRLLGSVTLARAARGEEDVAGQSVLKLLGSEAVQAATEQVLGASRVDGLVHPALTGPVRPAELGFALRQLVRPLPAHLRGDHRRWNVGDPAKHHRPADPWPAAKLTAARITLRHIRIHADTRGTARN